MQQVLESKEDVFPQQQEWNPSLGQKDSDPLDIKEEQEELWSEDEEKPQSSQLHQSQRDESTEVELLVGNSTEHRTLKKEATGDDCGGSEPASNSSLFSHLQPDTDDIQQCLLIKEILLDQQEWNQSVDQEDIKEEQGKLWISQQEQQLHQLEDDGVTKFPFTVVTVKSENDDEKPQSSQVHQSQSDESTEAEPEASSSTVYRTLRAKADGEDDGGPQPASKSGPYGRLQPDTNGINSDSSETETDNSCEWKQIREVHSGLNGLSEGGKARGYMNHSKQNTGMQTSEKSFSCPKCGKKFGYKSNVVRHMRIHSNSGPNSHLQPDTNDRNSDSCENETADSYDWEQNRNLCSHFNCLKNTNVVSSSNCKFAEKQFNCSKYGKAYCHINSLGQHKERQASVKPSSCPDGGKNLRQKGSLNTHARIDTGEKPFGCSECAKRFGQKGEWTRHMKIHTGQKPFGCSECSQRFRQNSDWARHMLIHTGQKPFGCSECGQRFRQKSDRTRHMIIHTEQKPFGCSKCGQRFRRKSNLNTHMIIHTGQKPYGCAECGQRFGQKSNLNTHMLTHTRQKPFDCTECGQRFGRKSSLKTHMIIHSGQKPFGCSQCGQRFGRKSSLKTHMMIHSGQKPFDCSECGQRFGQKGHLQTHMIIHTRQKPFGCSECGQRFGQKSHLNRHITVHSRQKPFVCFECSRSFGQKIQLSRHMTIHTRQVGRHAHTITVLD